MKNKNKIATGIGVGLTALASGQVTGNLNAHISQAGNESNYIRANAFYGLHLGIKGYTFVDAYKNNTIFGKTFLTKNIGKDLALKTETIHAGNEDNPGFNTQTGMGIEYSHSDKDTAKSIFDNIKYAKVNYLPRFVDKNGETIPATQAIGYAVAVNLPNKIGKFKLPKNIEVSSFGQIKKSENGTNWGYGEAEIIKNFRNKFIGWNGALVSKQQGGIIPRVQHRFTMGARF